MRIGFILGGSNLVVRPNPVTLEVICILRSRGADVEIIEPRLMNYELSELKICHDLYVIKSIADPAAASYGKALHMLGAPTFNPYPVVERIRNKIATLRLLIEHGIPVPSTYVAVDGAELAPLVDEGPLIIKPYMGSGGIGVKIVTTRDELLSAAGPPPVLAQRFHPSDDGLDHKISFIGGKVFGVKRVFPIREYEEKIGTPIEIDDETAEIANSIADALTIDLFSFDLIVSRGRPYVVDVGSFGSMMGVPDAAELVAARIIRAWEERAGK